MKKEEGIFRILDANINRAREGLRVIEDISRFIFNSTSLTKKIKEVRHLISKALDRHNLILSRDISKDIGRSYSFDKKVNSLTLESVLTANILRIEESTRVLEEFSKLVMPEKTVKFKKARFLLYDIEKEFYKILKRPLRNN